jgi:hypothetical protein
MWGNVAIAQSPIITQTYTDRCTGETFTFSVSSNGQTVVLFYNKSRVFTANDFQNGVLRAWLEETYGWWRNLSPCSAAQTSTIVAQQTAQQAATQAATNIPSIPSPPPPPPPSPPPPSPPPPSSSNSPSSNSSNSNSSSNSSPQEKNNGETGGGETESGGGNIEEKSSGSEENNSSEENNNESESSDNEESSENSSEEEEKEEKKKTVSPPVVVANLASMQGLDGKFTTALSLGISRSSLLGDKSYGVNSMIWSNMRQFLIVGNYSKTHIIDNKVDMISSTTMGVAKMYSTYLFTMGHSKVFPNKNGSVFGFNFANNIMSMESSPTKRELSGSFNSVLFYTKPFNFIRLSLSPLLAIASSIINYNFTTKTMSIPSHILISGNNFNYTLTQRFVANLGIMATSSLSNEFSTTYMLTIGSRFQF